MRAARVEISGDVPRGGGLSSSAALEVALTLALIALAGVPEPDRIELAKICSKIENDWVGAQTGLLDQLASLLGEDDHALRIDFRSLEITQVPLELGEFKLVTLHSGERHSNAGSGYNERRRECALAAEELGVPSLRDATLEAAAALPSPLDRRAKHIITENERVDAAVAALERRDMDELGRLARRLARQPARLLRGVDPRCREGRRASCTKRGRWEPGSSAAASAATCSG